MHMHCVKNSFFYSPGGCTELMEAAYRGDTLKARASSDFCFWNFNLKKIQATEATDFEHQLNPQHFEAENLKEIAEIDSGEGSGGERGRCGCRGCLWPRTPFPIRYLQHFRWTERTRYKVDEIWSDENVHNISISFPQYFHDDSFFVTLVWCSDVVFIHLPWIPGVKACTVGFFFLRNLRLDGGLPALSLETSWKSSANRRGKPMAGSLRCEEQVGFAEETLCRIWKQKKQGRRKEGQFYQRVFRQIESVKMLLELGADINKASKTGRNYLSQTYI